MSKKKELILINFDKKELGRFAISGFLSTGFAYISFPLIYHFFSNDYFNLSFFISAILNYTVSYTLLKYLAFRVNKRSKKEFIIFCINATFIAIICYVLLKIFIFNFEMKIILANAIVVTISAVLSFVIHKLITFKKN